MRWMWIDRFVEFDRARRAVALKSVSLAEESVDGYVPGFPVMPNSLIIEGMAQTAGLLVAESGGFKERVVLAKLGKALFHRLTRPGDTLTYTAEVEDIKHDGAIVRCTSHIGGQPQADAELIFAYLDERFEGDDLFEPANLLCMLRLLGLYDVGRKQDGSPLEIPQRMLDAEREANAYA
jgi:3-hydroxyacyl-[acyl-carrier-protein] dehydratase